MFTTAMPQRVTRRLRSTFLDAAFTEAVHLGAAQPDPACGHTSYRRSGTVRSIIATFVFLTVGMALLTPTPASAQNGQPVDPNELAEEGLVPIDSVRGGSLLLQTDQPGWYVPAPLLETHVDVAVSGPIARAVVSQRFNNVADVFVEGRYVFPLPEGAAVDTLRMKVDDRWVEGKIEEREEAKLIYEEAKAAGQVASLVEQERPNVFVTSVANIAPGADVVVQIEYQELLSPRNGLFGLRVPLVVAPRYVPFDQREPTVVLTEKGWMLEESDGQRVVPPVIDPRTDDQTNRNPVTLSVDLDSGFPVDSIESVYHEISSVKSSPTTSQVELTGAVPADRDFLLTWKAAPLDQPYAAVFAEEHDGEVHHVAVLTPPSVRSIEKKSQPRKVVFVQDTSGSMSGESIEQARAGLIAALERLDEDDLFNIIEFNSYMSTFETKPVPATTANVNSAKVWVRQLRAEGGTEMLPALKLGLEQQNDGSDERLQQIIFLTDGAVSDEVRMLELIEEHLGKTRLFTVGIGSAPNSYFMTTAARTGRGSSVFIGDLDEVSTQMEALFAKIENPAIVDLSLGSISSETLVSPSPLPDLYTGDPVVLTIRNPNSGSVPQTLALSGTRGEEPWTLNVSLDKATPRPGVSKLWAREQIRDLEALRISHETSDSGRKVIDGEILDLAVKHSLVTRLTSLVAVDLEVTRPADESSTSTDVATNLPAGWDPEVFFDQSERTVEAVSLENDQLSRLQSADESRKLNPESNPAIRIPKGGANWMARALLGTALAVVGLTLMVRRRSTLVQRSFLTW